MIDHTNVVDKYIQDASKKNPLSSLGIENKLISKNKLDKFAKLYLKKSKSVVDEVRIKLLEFQLNLSLSIFQTDLDTLKKDLDDLKSKKNEKVEESKEEKIGSSNELVNQNIKEIYNQIEWEKPSFESFSLAYVWYENLSDKVQNKKYLTIVDFSKSREQKRLYVINLKNKEVEYNTKVWHWENSWEEYASGFSNTPWTHKSSLWFIITNSKYESNSKWTWEWLRLYWLENWINDQTDERGIFMHSGDIKWSEWCLTIPKRFRPREIMDKIKWKSLIFAYYPDDDYLASSEVLKNNKNI